MHTIVHMCMYLTYFYRHNFMCVFLCRVCVCTHIHTHQKIFVCEGDGTDAIEINFLYV